MTQQDEGHQIRPTQVDLQNLTDEKAATSQIEDRKWDDPRDLEIQALICRAMVLEIIRKGGDPAMIGSEEMKALRIAQAAIRSVRQRMPIA